MRLLNAHDLHFEEFYDSDIPRYAILSHRWGREEVSFEEMRKSNGGKRRKGPGWDKIRSTCKLASKEKFTWVWIDTCCINKDSSAELTEAINSMFHWYARSSRCYVYLSDIQWNFHVVSDSVQTENLGRSSWFSRGWTLQELLAPGDLHFYDMDWSYIGQKSNMINLLAKVTKIDIRGLNGLGRARDRNANGHPCVAEKMSWASGRQTSRVEDMAYSLLGLFDVNMPLLYGEGRKAFYRLELEIMKQSDDESIFAWVAKGHLSHTGMLAPWPDAFKYSGVIMRNETKVSRPPFAMTNKGLEMRIPESSLKQGCDNLHQEDPSATQRAGVLTLHLDCFAMIGTTQSTARAWAPIKVELEQLGGRWARRAQRLSWMPYATEEEKRASRPGQLASTASELDWRSDKEVTIHVQQEDVKHVIPRWPM